MAGYHLSKGRAPGNRKERRGERKGVMEMRQISQEACLLCLFGFMRASEKKTRGGSANSEKEVNSGRDPWVDFLTSMIGCERGCYASDEELLRIGWMMSDEQDAVGLVVPKWKFPTVRLWPGLSGRPLDHVPRVSCR